MKIVKPNAKLLDHDKLNEYQFIETAGRICYKSENKITEDSAVKFTQMLLKNNHTAMLEHGMIYFTCSPKTALATRDVLKNMTTVIDLPENLVSGVENLKESLNHLNIVIAGDNKNAYISGSFRVFNDIFNNDSIPILKLLNNTLIFKVFYFSISKKYPEIFNPDKVCFNKNDDDILKYYGIQILDRNEFINSVKSEYNTPDTYYIRDTIFRICLAHTIVFTCDRGVSHEFVRHRPCSFAQESTRYCNYQQDKFGNEIAVIEPLFYIEENRKKEYEIWKKDCENSEKNYFDLLALGSTPQEARSVLPTSLKTELVITATENEWQHIVNLRSKGTTGKPHPQMKEVMDIALPLLVDATENRVH